MLEWLKHTEQQPDHPMYDLEQAALLLAELPDKDAAKALEELCSWLHSLTEADGFPPELRARILLLVEDAGRPFIERLHEEYLKEQPPQDAPLLRLVASGVRFGTYAARAHAHALQQLLAAPDGAASALAPQLAVRGLRALFERRKLGAMRGYAVDAGFWQRAFALYNAALGAHIAAKAVKAYAEDAQYTQAKYEFARVLMLDIARADLCQPREIELIARAAARCAGSMLLATSAGGCVYGIDLAKPAAPAHSPPAQSDALRFIDARPCLVQIKEMIARNSKPEDPERRLGENFTLAEKLGVMRHLLLYWGSDAPHRHGVHVKLAGHANVALGFDALCQAVHGAVEPAPASGSGSSSGISFDGEQGKTAAAPEPWRIEYVGDDGVDLAVGGHTAAALKVGTLCGFQLEGNPQWSAGRLRRIRREAEDSAHAEIETLAAGVMPFSVSVVEQASATPLDLDAAAEAPVGGSLTVLIQHHAGAALRPGLLLIAPAGYAEGRLLELACEGSDCQVRVGGATQRGSGYVLAAFELVSSTPRAPEPAAGTQGTHDWQ